MSWYKTGTIAATNGSKIITGTGTQFTNPLNGVSAGRMLLLPAAGTVQVYEIESVQSDTQLTLVSAFTGTTGTGKAYAIPTSPAVSVEQFAHEFASTLAYYQQQLSGWQQILTGTGNVTLTTPDGQTVTVRSQKAWDDALNGKVTGVKQSSSTDATVNAIMALASNGEGSFGLGSTAVPTLTVATTLNAVITAAKTGLYKVPSGTAGSPDTSVGWYFLITRYSSASAGIFAYSADVGNQKIAQGNVNNGVFNGWVSIWNSANLTPADMYGARGTLGTADLDTIFGPAYRGVWDQGATANATLARHYPINSAGSLEVIYNAANAVGVIQRYTTHASNRVFIRYKARDLPQDTWSAWVEYWTSDNLVKQTGIYDSAIGSVLLNGAHGLGRSQAANIPAPVVGDGNNAVATGFFEPSSNVNFYQQFCPVMVAFRAGGADGTGQLMQIQAGTDGVLASRYRNNNVWTPWINHVSISTSQTITATKTHTAPVVTANAVAFRGTLTDGVVRNIGHVNAQNIVHLGDGAAPTTIHGFAMPLIQIGTGASYAVVDTGTNQTITGAKRFTSAINCLATNPTVGLEASGVTEATVGRWMQITNNGGALRAYIRAGSAGAPISAGERVITIPTAVTGTALVTGNNAIADANGFWKTASPVVKLFADGTSELTSEAEGITTERLSEGVYRISGCLGLNADRAWGGDDGGIDVPMCRNKLPRLWVDYGGDEGSAQINPDGSIVIRTYHRPHPDAPVFARNEIEGYANGDPIDIPHDTFISVRVQMPAVEAQETVVEKAPNAVESDVVLETSTPV